MIPFLDLKAQYRTIEDEIKPAVHKVLESTQYVLGSEVKAFEEEFADYVGANHGVACNTGTSALHLALMAAGVGSGDEVITVPFTFIATAAAIHYTGATPVFVDVDPVSFTMDPTKLEGAITPKTKAIIPVHLYGQAADMDPIMAIARRHNLIVIEDAAQAHGARYNDRPVGSIGDFACFSFYPGKNLGAYGEGGLTVTQNDDFAHSMRILRDWGQEEKYHHKVMGYNYRMDGIQGAILRVKLRHLEAWTEGRRAHAAVYNERLGQAGINIPAELPGRRHVYHVYAIRTPVRTQLQAALKEKEIHSGIHYPIPVHLQEAFAYLGHKRGDFPCSELVADEVLSLPMYAEMSSAAAETVCKAVTESLYVRQ